MRADQGQTYEYNRMRGEYLGLMASLEFNLTFLLVEWLDIGSHREEFHNWFIEAPIPFRYKVRLFESFTQDSWLIEDLGDLAGRMRESYDFRNTLAHSFRQGRGITTSRGAEVPAEQASLETLQDKLETLANLDNFILNLLANEIEGPPERVFTDDYADWPFGLFLP